MDSSIPILPSNTLKMSINKIEKIRKNLINIAQTSDPKKVPLITAQSWSIHESISGTFLWGNNEATTSEIASLTKVMTAYCSLNLSKKYKIDINNTYTIISPEASDMNGTTAYLVRNFTISIIDLFYSLLLPSGNDAAIVLGEFFGQLLMKDKEFVEIIEKNSPTQSIKNPIETFVCYMNITAKELGMTKTYYVNPHGLTFKENYSCPRDLGILASKARKNPIFSQIVQCKEYESNQYDPEHKCYPMKLDNTNQILGMGFDGMKTGITPSAGPCLIATCKAYGITDIIIILINCRTPEIRWNEALILKNWVGYKILSIIKNIKEKHKSQKNSPNRKERQDTLNHFPSLKLQIKSSF